MALKRGKSQETEQDFELNIASIIDCFTVLIAYLLVAASFISIGFFDVGVAVDGNITDSTKIEPITIELSMGTEKDVLIRVSGRENRTMRVTARDGDWDFDTLQDQLLKLRSRWPDIDGAVLGAQNSVNYEEVVKAVEVVRSALPQVFLGNQ